jgi:hypothetical protein
LKFYLYFIFLLFFALNIQKTNAQYISVHAIVVDAHTKEPVNFASVYSLKSGYGKTTDSTGAFTLTVLRTDTIAISYVGYQLNKIPVSNIKKSDSSIIVYMERGKLSDAVVIKTKVNKGLFLWRKIMSKKKQYNRYDLTNFSYEAYNKLEVDIKNFNPDKLKKNFLLKPFAFVFDNIDSTSEKAPFLPAYLLESVSDYAYQKKTRKFFENIKASNTKGFNNESITKMLGVMNQNVNVYGNFINVMDKDFIGPLNDNADEYYNFSVPDTQMLTGRKIFHFVFKPKRAGINAFNGDAWVFSQTYQIQKVSLYLAKDANVNFIDRVSIFQEFTPINDSIYFLTRDKFFADFSFLGKKSLTLIGRKSTSYKDITINSDSITNLFDKQNIEEVITTEKNVSQYSDTDWVKLRHDSLSKNEKSIYGTIDKLLQMPKFQKLEKRLHFIGTGYTDNGNVEFGPWFNWVSSNAWEGTRFRFDLGTNTGFNKNIYLHGYLAYGLKDKRIKGQAEAYWILNRNPNRFRLHVSYSKDIDNGISNIGEVSQDNIFSLAIRKPSVNRKFLKLQDTRLEVFKELGKGVSTELFFVHRQFTPLLNLPFVDSPSGPSFNNFEVALKLRFAYLERFVEGDYFRYSLGSKYPIAEIILAQGIPGIAKSAYSYTKLSASIKDYIKISPYGSISYKVYAGKIFGTLPYTFLESHPGNDIYYYNANSYNLMNRFEYLSNQYAGVNFEHNIGSGIFAFTHLTRKLKWRQFWNVKTLWGSLSPQNAALNNSTANFKTLNGNTYMELGTGIDNIFKVFRLDFVWRVLPSSNYYKLQKNQAFGIFGSFQFQF